MESKNEGEDETEDAASSNEPAAALLLFFLASLALLSLASNAIKHKMIVIILIDALSRNN